VLVLYVKFLSMTNVTGKVFIGVGAAWLVLGAICLPAYSRIWGIYSILIGISFVLSGVSLSPQTKRQKVIRGLSFGFLGAALVFFVIWLVQSPP
jgi:hypothetical protein